MRADLSSLSRLWFFPPIEGIERAGVDVGTYWAYPLDAQPAISTEADSELSWLEHEPDAPEWGIHATYAPPTRPLGTGQLTDLVGAAHLVPRALSVLADRLDLQRRIRSYTACYLDLLDRAVPVEGGGCLIHVLADQQWVRHWFVLLDGSGSAPVLSSQRPIGSDQTEGDVWPSPLPPVIPLDGSVGLALAEDSLERFLYRFWIENEIAFQLQDGQALTGRFGAYAALIR